MIIITQFYSTRQDLLVLSFQMLSVLISFSLGSVLYLQTCPESLTNGLCLEGTKCFMYLLQRYCRALHFSIGIPTSPQYNIQKEIAPPCKKL